MLLHWWQTFVHSITSQQFFISLSFLQSNDLGYDLDLDLSKSNTLNILYIKNKCFNCHKTKINIYVIDWMLVLKYGH